MAGVSAAAVAVLTAVEVFLKSLGALVDAGADLLRDVRINFVIAVLAVAIIASKWGDVLIASVPESEAGTVAALIVGTVLGGILVHAGNLIAGPNPLATIAEKAIDKLKG